MPCDSKVQLLGVYLQKNMAWRDKCILLFISALLIIAKTWKQPKCSLTDEWIKMVCTHTHSDKHTLEYYSVIKKKETVPFAAMWIGTLLRCLAMISTSWYSSLSSVNLSSRMLAGPSAWFLMHQICTSYELSPSRLGHKRLEFLFPCSPLSPSLLMATNLKGVWKKLPKLSLKITAASSDTLIQFLSFFFGIYSCIWSFKTITRAVFYHSTKD